MTEPYEFKDLDEISKKSTVDHPPHYTHGTYETIDIIEDWGLDYHVGNAVKYLSRAGKKDPNKYIEDLQKAIWYIDRKIMLEENK